MASRERNPKRLPLFPFLSLVCFVSVFLILSLIRNTSFFSLSPRTTGDRDASPTLRCDLSDGAWIRGGSPARYDHTCKEIFKGWNCVAGNKSNGLDLLQWRWKPRLCELSRFDPQRFLRTYANTSIGTSLSRFLNLRSELRI